MFIRKYRKISGDKDSEECDFIAFCLILDNFRLLNEPKKEETEAYREKKVKFLFDMYDEGGDGKITKHEFIVRLKAMVGDKIDLEPINAIAEQTIAETDTDRSGEIGYDEFKDGLKDVDVIRALSLKFT